MSANVDRRLLGAWLESRARQESARARLARCSLPSERFEGWALDLIAQAVPPEATAPASGRPFTVEPS